jgi:hypothetical protein
MILAATIGIATTAAIGAIAYSRLFPKQAAAQKIAAAQVKIETVVHAESVKIETAVLSELNVLALTGRAAVVRAEKLVNTGAVSTELADGLRAAGTSLSDAVLKIEQSMDPKHFPVTAAA